MQALVAPSGGRSDSLRPPVLRPRPRQREILPGNVLRSRATSVPDLERSDDDLLSASARGDHDSFAALYDRYADIVHSMSRRMLRDERAAEDATQEAFIKIWRGAASFASTATSARAWLITIAQRHFIDVVRRERRMAAVGAQPAAEAPADELAAHATRDGEDASTLALRAIEASHLRDVIRHLPEQERVALFLAYHLGYTHSEIAERLDVPIGTVKTRLYTAVKRLRERTHFDDSDMVGAAT